MKFKTSEDIDASIDEVFAHLTDADALEAFFTQRGGKIERTPAGPITQGTTWQGEISFRGKSRSFTSRVQNFDAPQRLFLLGGTSGMEMHLALGLVPLSGDRTRLAVVLEVKPRTIAARLLIQSAKLARGKLSKRFKKRVAQFAANIEMDEAA